MARPVSVSQIETQINNLHAGVSKVAGYYRNNRADFSADGLQRRYEKAVADKRFDYQGKAQRLANLVDNLEPAAQAQAATARAKVAPTAADSTEQLAAEMQAQRLLSRPGIDATTITTLIRDTEPSPGLTLAIDEWQARGLLDADTAEAALVAKSPEYSEAKTAAGRATQMAGFLRQRLNKATEQMTTTTPVETQYVPSVDAALKRGWNDTITVDEVPDDVFDDVKVDPAYRAE